MSELPEAMKDKKQTLRSLIEKLHSGANPEELKKHFKEILGQVTAADIAQLEEELIKEGMPREEVQRLCDVHLAVFKESLEKDQPLAPPGHPINILMEEHRLLLEFAGQLKLIADRVKSASDVMSVGEELNNLTKIMRYLKESESHYVREENVLFPYLEKHGVTQPPAIMWTEHNTIRETKKQLYKTVDNLESLAFRVFSNKLNEAATSLASMLGDHFFKENKILFPTALKVMETSEWPEIRRQFDEIGYCSFTPRPTELAAQQARPEHEWKDTGVIPFETGSLSREEIESMLDSLPVDITFVDKEDTVRYFSQSKDRIFPRTKAVIGRKVQQCHPQASVHRVVQILEDFRNNRRDRADFWINLKGRLIFIRYFAVRKDGSYLGCLEVTQDITDVQKITGEKRLLD